MPGILTEQNMAHLQKEGESDKNQTMDLFSQLTDNEQEKISRIIFQGFENALNDQNHWKASAKIDGGGFTMKITFSAELDMVLDRFTELEKRAIVKSYLDKIESGIEGSKITIKKSQ